MNGPRMRRITISGSTSPFHGRARVSGRGVPRETLTSRPLWQQYGMASRPLEGAQALLFRDGEHLVILATEDARHRIALEQGEVAIYSDEGDKVHLKRGREIHVSAGSKVTIEAPTVEVRADTVQLGEGAAQGVVTAQCICAFTGGPHPDKSSKVSAVK